MRSTALGTGGSFETTALVLPEQDSPIELLRATDGEQPAAIRLPDRQRKSPTRHSSAAIRHDPAWPGHEFIRSNKVNALGACIRNGGGNA